MSVYGSVDGSSGGSGNDGMDFACLLAFGFVPNLIGPENPETELKYKTKFRT